VLQAHHHPVAPLHQRNPQAPQPTLNPCGLSNGDSPGRLRATTDFGVIADNDFVIVTVGTPLGPDFEPIVDHIKAAARSVGEHLHKGHLVILKSTVPPDTTEKVFRPIVEEHRNVLGLSHRHGTDVVFASTSEVFGKNPNPPFGEDDDRVLGSTRTARWSYSTSKAMAEHLVFAMHTAYALPVTVVRYFNVYGP
jgi:UDP-N-acetyl-D-mannosaminuronate dehydrogenase